MNPFDFSPATILFLRECNARRLASNYFRLNEEKKIHDEIQTVCNTIPLSEKVLYVANTMAIRAGYDKSSEEYKSFVCHYMILFDNSTC